MKFELKTENDNYSKSFSQVLGMIFFLALIIPLCDIALNLRIIARNHLIEYNCSLLSVEKSALNFKKLSSLSNLKSKQGIWEFCKQVVK